MGNSKMQKGVLLFVLEKRAELFMLCGYVILSKEVFYLWQRAIYR